MATTASAEMKKLSVVDGEGKVRVLVVDDDPISRKIHVALVRRFGGVAVTAENGEEAVNIHRAGASFNLVLMDKEMPIMDGPSATKELRAMGVTSMIVGVTSLGNEEEHREAFMEAGLNQCFGKPLNIEKIAPVFNQLKETM
ncbi:PREDICTED: two-component response regulator ARR22 [Tarenaya hassleriana]|uniref:two-component response regulator ARR22 n=1 Tax=Tarenaya hassleriana TaxID=28532 RepID=UPI00053C4C1A|nr:PREDICTED: two-component response regulator ARR22 [Tarenaya hassleriana]